ncbi:hypothetical protein F2Q68_00044771 [Brassica cretica]|uniref:DUF223 domain-containing protein n=1 Tax=Brassica cretica TaxID=69181 RepID=A0A8S9LIU5_BRACR|nr:hypothetical protein F2Q68_00044771 [Brassica cretica]
MRSSICNGSSIINGLKSVLITTTKLPPAPYLCYIKISPVRIALSTLLYSRDSFILESYPSSFSMAMAKVFFSNLKSGRCSSVVEARLLRFWEARNVKRGGELMWMDLLMVDVNSTMMQVTISAGRLPQFREMLHARTMFSVSGFDVSRCAQNFWLTDSSLMIRFNESTSFQELTEPVSPLPEEAFRFRNQSELIGLANTNTQLPDIIGEILSVKSTVCDPPEEKNRVMVTLKLDRYLTSCSSIDWNEHPEFPHSFLGQIQIRIGSFHPTRSKETNLDLYRVLADPSDHKSTVLVV